MQETSQRTGEVVTAGVFFAIGLVWILGSLEMPHGEFHVPGPGFFPILLGVALCVSALLLAVAAILTRTSPRVSIGNARIWLTSAAILALAVLFEPLGFIPTIALFVGFFLMLLSGLRWFTCIVVALAAAWAVYLFFGVLLGIPLPRAGWL